MTPPGPDHEPTPTPPPPQPPAVAPAGPLSQSALARHVEYLCSDELAGRYAGSDGERLAAAYVEAELTRAGVGPIPNHGRRQEVPVGPGVVSQNVYGYLPGTGASEEILVVGAHIDHMGIQSGEMYRGAEDNASGTAVLLEIARVLAELKARRAILFAFFGAEEVGLVGARAFIAKPPVERDRIRAMVNIDMIGRPLADNPLLAVPKLALDLDGDHAVGVIGTSERPMFREAADEAFAAEGIRVVGPEDFSGPLQSVIENLAKNRGDNWPFEWEGIPTMFFSSGESSDYHEPSDTPDKLDYDIMQRRGRALAQLIEDLANTERAFPEVVTAP